MATKNMLEARLKFEREGLEGIIPVGSYLADAAGRFGVRFDEKCVGAEGVHHCRIMVTEGSELLSEPTEAEAKAVSGTERGEGWRLACQVKVVEPGEIVVMTEPKEEKAVGEEAEAKPEEDFSKKFAELPLEKKIAELVRLEAIAFGDTVSFIFNSPYLVFDKAMDVLAEFGMKKEIREKSEARPAEHLDPDKEGKEPNRTRGRSAKNKDKSKESEAGTDT